MISYEVRNIRGLVVRTFGSADMALTFATAHSHALGALQAYAVETIRRERLLTAEPEITAARHTHKRSA